MNISKNCFSLITAFGLICTIAQAQNHAKVVAGVIFIGDNIRKKDEKHFAAIIDSLDHNLKLHPHDTTSLFYRALFYLQFNGFVVNPDLTNKSIEQLLLAIKMADRADSLNMQSIDLKILRAQLCKQLTNRFAPIEQWRFSDKQIAERKKRFEYFKGLANKYYDEAALIDSDNAYDYQRLKVK